MTSADQYRIKAGDLASLARAEKDPFQKAEYERLSLAYLRLADQADRNSRNDVVWFDPLIDKPSLRLNNNNNNNNSRSRRIKRNPFGLFQPVPSAPTESLGVGQFP